MNHRFLCKNKLFSFVFLLIDFSLTLDVNAPNIFTQNINVILYKNEYDQYETSLFAKGQKHPLPIFTDTIELINKIKEDKFNALDAQESIQADYFSSSINQGIDFFYK